MADNNRGRPRDDDRDIYSSSREQRNSQRAPRYQKTARQMDHAAELKDNRIVLNERNSSAQQNQRRNSGRTNRPPASDEDIDRYNYVNRDIYSSSKKSKKNGGGDDLPPRKKKKKAKKIIIAIICVVVAIIIGVVAFVAIMLSRINYKPVDTTSYVEQPSDAPTWDVNFPIMPLPISYYWVLTEAKMVRPNVQIL